MASELSMNGRKKIETLQKEFTQKFTYLTLVFLDKERRAIDISKSLSEVRQAKGADISIIASLKVNTLEKRFLENFGLIVEVAYQKSDKVVYTKDNVDKTLNELNKWCQNNDCQPFEFKKSFTGNTLSSVQEQLFEAIKAYYPNAEAKKINKDNYLDIYLPEINKKRGTHLYFNTAKDGIKIGFYCRDEEFVEAVLSRSTNIEQYAQGIRILDNPLQNDVEEATASALSFIEEITGENIYEEDENEDLDSILKEMGYEEEDDEDEDDEEVEEDDDDQDEYNEDEEIIYQWACLSNDGSLNFNINCSSLNSISENLFTFQIGEKFGVVDISGKIIVPCKYDQIFKYNFNLARVQSGGRWTGKYGYIDIDGNEVINCKYEDADEFCDDLARVKINDKWGFIDKKGEEVIPPIYAFVKNFSEGLAGVTKNDQYGFINKNDELVIDYKFDSVEDFKDGFSIVGMGGTIVDDAYVRGKLGLIDTKGNLLTKCIYNYINSFSDNVARVSIGGNEYGLGEKIGFIDKKGQEVIPCIYDSADNFVSGVSIVSINDSFNYIDTKQNILLNVNYEYANNFANNLALVSQDDKYGYINKNGDIVIELIYDDAMNFNLGFAYVKVDEAWGMIDSSGREVIKPIFEEIEAIPNSKYIIFKKDEKYKLINKLESLDSEEEYEEIVYSENGSFIFCKIHKVKDAIKDIDEGVTLLPKKELFTAIWEVIGGYLFNYSYITTVYKEEAEYIESHGLGCEILEEVKDNVKVKIKIKIENYVEINFNQDLINNFKIDKLKGNKFYKSSEIEKWVNKCFNNLCHLFSGFTVLGGEKLHPEDGDSAWNNENTIYLQMPDKIFKLTDLNKKWDELEYFLDDEKLVSFISELNN